MKIGDKVRFLSEVGGGIVAGFQDKNIVLVEDADGFQIPMQVKECVVVDTDDYNIAKVHTDAVPNIEPKKKVEKVMSEDPSDLPVSYIPKPEERNGGDSLSAYLAFVPVDIKEISNTKFEAYFVNDSNYYMYYSYLTAEGANWRVRAVGEVEPNTKLFIEEFERDVLNELAHIGIQIIAYKKERSFMLKPTLNVEFRIDTVKFYKLHTFQENDFFETPALLYTIVENDKPSRQLVIDAKELKESMLKKKSEDEHPHVMPARKEKKDDDIVVVDLHSSELLDTTSGMQPTDILNYQLDTFRKTIEQYKSKKGQKIVFIHGKGEGVLRHAIVSELKYKYKNYPYQDASFQEYGYGATQVTIR